RQSLGERPHRELQRASSRRTPRWRDLLLATRGANRHRELATSLQLRQAARGSRLQTASTRGVRARARRVAGCATSNASAGHASTQANLKLTFHLGYSVGAGHLSISAQNSNTGWLLPESCERKTTSRRLLRFQ